MSETLKAVPTVPAPDQSTCTLFERGHHAHPIQVSMAMKKGGDDGGFVPVTLESYFVEEASWGVNATGVVLHTEAGERLDLLNHDAALADHLAAVENKAFVWEPEFGVLFPLTDQARAVLGTGAITLAETPLSTCIPPEKD